MNRLLPLIYFSCLHITSVMSTIVDLYSKYGITSQYMYLYDRLLEPYRHSVIQKMEIGCGGGVKTQVMCDYFADAEKIVGIDIDASQVDPEFAVSPKIVYRNVDATLEGAGFLAGGEKCDVIIEDTWLNGATQARIFNNIAPYVAPGGVYIIERFAGSINLQNQATKYGATSEFFEFDEGDQIAVIRF